MSRSYLLQVRFAASRFCRYIRTTSCVSRRLAVDRDGLSAQHWRVGASCSSSPARFGRSPASGLSYGATGGFGRKAQSPHSRSLGCGLRPTGKTATKVRPQSAQIRRSAIRPTPARVGGFPEVAEAYSRIRSDAKLRETHRPSLHAQFPQCPWVAQRGDRLWVRARDTQELRGGRLVWFVSCPMRSVSSASPLVRSSGCQRQEEAHPAELGGLSPSLCI